MDAFSGGQQGNVARRGAGRNHTAVGRGTRPAAGLCERLVPSATHACAIRRVWAPRSAALQSLESRGRGAAIAPNRSPPGRAHAHGSRLPAAAPARPSNTLAPCGALLTWANTLSVSLQRQGMAWGGACAQITDIAGNNNPLVSGSRPLHDLRPCCCTIIAAPRYAARLTGSPPGSPWRPRRTDGAGRAQSRPPLPAARAGAPWEMRRCWAAGTHTPPPSRRSGRWAPPHCPGPSPAGML